MSHRAKLVGALGLAACLCAPAPRVGADVAPEEVGQVARLPDTVSDHWLWVPDRLFRHSILLDGDSGKMLGAVDSGAQITPKAPLWSRTRNEIYNIDTIYSRGHRGERHDYLVIYDSRTLEVKGEVEIPPKAADTGTGIALVGLIDGERFAVVLNQSPGASVSVVDVEARRMVAEIQTAGCAAVFPAGPARFGMLCGDGTAITVHLKENGELDRIARSVPFFEVVADPITEKGVRDGSTWWFASFGGQLYEVDISGDAPAPKAPTRVPAIELVGTGDAVLFHNGVAVRGTWSKESKSAGFELFLDNGAVMVLPPSRLWVSIFPSNRDITWE